MNVLLTNDDGIKAAGLRALLHAMPEGVRVHVVAPASEKSACSHSISLGQKLRVEQFSANGVQEYVVHGTPVDCVKFALSELKGFKPDLILSGINQGANTGVSVYYSGTISAAREGLINGVPSVAISLCSRMSINFEASLAFVQTLLCGYRDGMFLLDNMLNVNIPDLPLGKIQGVKITKQAASRFIEEFVANTERDGKKVYTLAGEIELLDGDGTSDEEAIMKGYISVTPLKLDLTDYSAMSFLTHWSENRFSQGDTHP